MKKYEMRDACFMCSSPYQIIGAISITLSLRLDADLYILKEFPNCELVAENLKKYNIFFEIHTVDYEQIIGKGRLKSIIITFFSNKIVTTYMANNIAYHKCFLTSRLSTLKNAQLHVLRERNPKTTLVIFEDGLGTYSDQGRLFKVSASRQVIERFLGWDLDNPQKIRLMAYLPELVEVPLFLKGHVVEKMPRIELNDTNRFMLTDIFHILKEQYINEKIIIFDTKRRGSEIDLLNSNEKTLLDLSYDLIKHYANDNVICKPHPKSKEKPKCGVKLYQYQGIPMEALYVNMPDLENRVLIAYVSTAVFTPKILLDCEPIVICLYGLLKESNTSKKFDPIFKKFKNTYRQQERVFSPKTIDELEKILRQIKEKFGEK